MLAKDEPKLYTLWSLNTYSGKTDTWIEKNRQEYEFDEKVRLLEKYDRGYHDRIDPFMQYKFFGDCDHFRKDIKDFQKLLIEFLKTCYNINIKMSDIYYTVNKSKKGSYHYVIPKYYASVQKLKEIHQNFLNEYEEFVYADEKGTIIKVVDVSVYSSHWFRCPNQSKKGDKDTVHKIITGTMKDFVLDYIEDTSICINDKKYLKDTLEQKKENKPKNKKTTETKIKESVKVETKSIVTTKDAIIKSIEWNILYKFIDECFAQSVVDTYQSWLNVGMGIKTRYGKMGFELFKYFSDKGSKPDPYDVLLKKYNTFKTDLENPITVAVLYKYAKDGNKDKYIELMHTCSPFKEFDLSPFEICRYIKMLRPNNYIWKDKTLYCYNGKYWEQDDLLLRIFISTDLYDFLKDILITCFWSTDQRKFDLMKRSLDRLKYVSFKDEIIKSTREFFTDNKIEFDMKWHLFGFTNKVLDLTTLTFRDYEYDDFISITTGYDWIEPTEEEVNTVNDLIKSIHPDEAERKLYLEIVATGLEGRCLEKINIFSGTGGNGKGLTDDMLIIMFGNYGIIANNAILFEKSKTGSNPEKNNLHKKRFVIFREPAEKSKIENSVVKELTGGGDFSARGHHESMTKKQLNMTMIIECNRKPLFAEEPTKAEIRRLIEIKFGCEFTENTEEVDIENKVFLADLKYKNIEFQQKHKTAFLKILLDAYKSYKERNYIFDVPKEVRDRTNSYLELSSNILTWIHDAYEKTTDKKDIIKIYDMFDNFKCSEYYQNLSKEQKRKYNKKYFITEISSNVFLKKYYAERKKIDDINYYNILTNYKQKSDEESQYKSLDEYDIETNSEVPNSKNISPISTTN